MKPADPVVAAAFTSFMMSRFRGLLLPEGAVSALFSTTIGFDPTRLLTARAMTLGPIVWMRDGLSPDDQMVTIVHECRHLAAWHDKPAEVSWLYLANEEFRVEQEVRAYLAGMEFTFARTKQIPATLDAVVEPMHHGYALSRRALLFAREKLEQAATMVAQGLVTTDSARVAIDWLEHNASELLAV
jgi:hypothetical protein